MPRPLTFDPPGLRILSAPILGLFDLLGEGVDVGGCEETADATMSVMLHNSTSITGIIVESEDTT